MRKEHFFSIQHQVVGQFEFNQANPQYPQHVLMSDIAESVCNLNIFLYVGSAQEEPEVDLDAAHAQHVSIGGILQEGLAKHDQFLIELGLPPLPSIKAN